MLGYFSPETERWLTKHDKKLSKNFWLHEFLSSRTAKKKGLVNVPTIKQIENLRYHAQVILQPIRDHFNCPLNISSGFRNHELNCLVGGVGNSKHQCQDYFAASDTTLEDYSLQEYFEYLTKVSHIPFHKAINEHGEWIHISSYRILRQIFEIK